MALKTSQVKINIPVEFKNEGHHKHLPMIEHETTLTYEDTDLGGGDVVNNITNNISNKYGVKSIPSTSDLSALDISENFDVVHVRSFHNLRVQGTNKEYGGGLFSLIDVNKLKYSEEFLNILYFVCDSDSTKCWYRIMQDGVISLESFGAKAELELTPAQANGYDLAKYFNLFFTLLAYDFTAKLTFENKFYYHNYNSKVDYSGVLGYELDFSGATINLDSTNVDNTVIESSFFKITGATFKNLTIVQNGDWLVYSYIFRGIESLENLSITQNLSKIANTFSGLNSAVIKNCQFFIKSFENGLFDGAFELDNCDINFDFNIQTPASSVNIFRNSLTFPTKFVNCKISGSNTFDELVVLFKNNNNKVIFQSCYVTNFYYIDSGSSNVSLLFHDCTFDNVYSFNCKEFIFEDCKFLGSLQLQFVDKVGIYNCVSNDSLHIINEILPNGKPKGGSVRIKSLIKDTVNSLITVISGYDSAILENTKFQKESQLNINSVELFVYRDNVVTNLDGLPLINLLDVQNAKICNNKINSNSNQSLGSFISSFKDKLDSSSFGFIEICENDITHVHFNNLSFVDNGSNPVRFQGNKISIKNSINTDFLLLKSTNRTVFKDNDIIVECLNKTNVKIFSMDYSDPLTGNNVNFIYGLVFSGNNIRLLQSSLLTTNKLLRVNASLNTVIEKIENNEFSQQGGNTGIYATTRTTCAIRDNVFRFVAGQGDPLNDLNIFNINGQTITAVQTASQRLVSGNNTV